MKVRGGFVSNSSTSSFVCLGYKIGDVTYESYIEVCNILNVKEMHIESEEDFEEDPAESFCDLSYRGLSAAYEGDSVYLGICGGSYDYDIRSVDITKKELDALQKLGETLSKPLKLYSGTSYC